MKNKTLVIKAFLIVFVLLTSLSAFAATSSERCLGQGTMQYQPNGSCATLSRECCGNGYFSTWGSVCVGKDSCSSSQCWNGSLCQNKPNLVCTIRNGTCTYSYTCSSSGWLSTKNVKCNNGWILDAGECIRYAYVYLDNGFGGSSCPAAMTCSAADIGKTCWKFEKVECFDPPGGPYKCICDNIPGEVKQCWANERRRYECGKTSF